MHSSVDARQDGDRSKVGNSRGRSESSNRCSSVGLSAQAVSSLAEAE